MLDMVGTIVGFIAITVNFVALLSALPLTMAKRLGLAALLGGWAGLASWLGSTDRLVFSRGQPIPYVGLLFAAPLIATGAAAVLSPRVRSALLGMPMALLIGLNSLRVVGLLFLFLAAAGRLAGPFPYSAAVGDFITAVAALPLAWALFKGRAISPALIGRWNVFGAADLFLAVALGLTSADGSPLQLLHFGIGSQAMQYLPFSMVPTVLVPFYLITHAIIAAQLATSSASERELGLAEPRHRPA